MGKKFEKDWYKVENRHALSVPMQALQRLSGNLNLFGMYMYLYDVTVKTEGEISKDDFEFLCETQANLSSEDIQKFIDCCVRRGLLILSEDGARFYMPEVQEYLVNVAELERKKFEDSSKGGKISAENRAKAREQSAESSGPEFKNAGHYIPNLGNHTYY